MVQESSIWELSLVFKFNEFVTFTLVLVTGV